MRLIDADALIEALTEYGNGRAVYISVEEAVRRIEQLPPAQPDTTTHDSIPAETGENDDDRTSGDCISRQQALETIKAMQTYKLFSGDDMVLVDKAEVQTNLMMLQSAQPERKGHGCEYCCEDSDGYVLSIEKNGHVYIQNGKLALRANGWWGECSINYCPMCGRKLRGETHNGQSKN